MSVYRERGRWRFEFDRRIGGQRVRRRVYLPGEWTREQAEAYARAQGAALFAIASGVAKPRHRIDEAVTRYLRERCRELKSGAGVARELEQMRDWWTGRFIDELHVVTSEYAEDQHGALAAATIKNRIAYLRAACRYAWRKHGMADSDPGARVVSPSVRNARDVTITRLQMVKLARACRHPGVRAMIRIGYWTGMRWGEIVAAKRAGDRFILPDTKGGTPRIVPALPIIRTAMRIPMPRRSEFDYYWPEARTAVGLEHVRFHDIRHTAGSDMVNAGEDLGAVGAVLGHKSSQTTKRYAHYATDRLAQALARRKA